MKHTWSLALVRPHVAPSPFAFCRHPLNNKTIHISFQTTTTFIFIVRGRIFRLIKLLYMTFFLILILLILSPPPRHQPIMTFLGLLNMKTKKFEPNKIILFFIDARKLKMSNQSFCSSDFLTFNWDEWFWNHVLERGSLF